MKYLNTKNLYIPPAPAKIAYFSSKPLEDLQLIDSESFDLRTRAVGAFLRGKKTAKITAFCAQ